MEAEGEGVDWWGLWGGGRWVDGSQVGWFVVAGECQGKVRCGPGLGLIESELSGRIKRVSAIREDFRQTDHMMWEESVKR